MRRALAVVAALSSCFLPACPETPTIKSLTLDIDFATLRADGKSFATITVITDVEGDVFLTTERGKFETSGRSTVSVYSTGTASTRLKVCNITQVGCFGTNVIKATTAEGLEATLEMTLTCPYSLVRQPLSTFETQDEGWRIVGDANSETPQGGDNGQVPEHDPEGGNPGGAVVATDLVTGGVWYWQSPASFSGQWATQAGGTLSFDMYTTATDGSLNARHPAVIIRGGGRSLHRVADADPATNQWVRFEIPLTPAGGWKVGSMNGAPATDEDIAMALQCVGSLNIRGEYRTGPDSGSLDNVIFTPGAP
ncbi:MAG: laminin B domain-containing protein [Myxococcota bacterium]